MQLEGICGVSMRYLRFEICREIDDCNSFEWTSKKNQVAFQVETRTCTHFLTHIPQPIQRNSEINAILSEDLTSIQSFPDIRDRQSLPL